MINFQLRQDIKDWQERADKLATWDEDVEKHDECYERRILVDEARTLLLRASEIIGVIEQDP